MLNSEVIEAVASDKFAIYAVETIDQALELLMATTAGTMNSTGRYPRKSIHSLALEKLAYFAELLEGESGEE